MKEITILSGKGGTGKTSVTGALAALAESCVFCDNDVDAADLHLLFQPEVREEHSFASGLKSFIDISACTQCGICADHCRFEAIHVMENGEYVINPFQCEGCRLCERVCPAEAIRSEKSTNNAWYVSDSRFGQLVHARMAPGEENSGKLVTRVRKKAKELAKAEGADYIINDGPPGIGCSTIASLSGTDIVLVIIEPTMSGLHDAKRLVDLARTFQVLIFAVINKFDINLDITTVIEEYLKIEKISLLAKIPFDENMVKAMTVGKTIFEYRTDSEAGNQLKLVWNALKEASLTT
ncbi:MAG: ATP-binding protein [Bacteroidales bacterium]|nr:ATP-binding protein [Bacteroidales bacterium]